MDVITINTIIQITKILIGFFISVFIPGYLLSFVFIPKGKINDTSYRLGIGFGMGFIFLIFIGSILMLSFGFLYPWMLVIILFLSSVIFFIKLRFINKEKIFSLLGLWKSIKQIYILLFLAALGIYIGSYITTHSIQNKTENFFSEFYLLDSTGALANTFNIDGAYTQPMVIGVTSHEQSPTDFSLVIKTENSMLRIVGPFTIQPGERWEHQITFSSEELPAIYLSQRIMFKLYKDSNFYRIVFLTVKKLKPIPTNFSRNN
jgi:uncharacterized membrane protein